MSSWKNASKANQRTHRERHQPKNREHLGILPKKKDYKKRAADFHEKQATLKLLRKRALMRNPDEFYTHMVNSRVIDGEHHEKPAEMADEDTAQQEKLINTQDSKYITMKRTAESKKVAKLQSELHLLDVANQTPNQHTFFVESSKEAKSFDLAKRLDTHPDLLSRRINRPRLGMLKTMSLTESLDPTITKEKTKRYSELAKRVEREHELAVVEQKLYIKRQLLKKKEGKPIKVSAGSKYAPPVYKWKYERKR
jgi:U3 small nucleolar RNA-associated protein 11